MTRLLTQPVRVIEKGVYRGPHRYSHTPMVRIQLDLGRMEDWPTDRLGDFSDRLLARLPGLELHGCCFGRRGGFVKRLREGTWLGHVAEHVALELQTIAGDRLTRGKTRSVKGHPGRYNVMYAYRDENVALAAGRFALELVDSLLPESVRGVVGLDRIWAAEGPYDYEARLEAVRQLVKASRFGPTTQALVDEAQRRGIPVMRLDDNSLIQLGYGRRQQRIRASISGRTSLVAVDIAGNKDLTKRLLAQAGVPVPHGVVVRDVEAALREARTLRYPLVTKPLDGNHGRGVTTDIRDEAQLRFGFAAAREHGRRIVVEQFFAGRDHRILIVDGQLVAVAERVPARVTGDGVSTIAELIEKVNQDPRRGEGHEKVMTRIRIDPHLIEFIARGGRTVETVPARGEVVDLRATANLSTGGTAIDRTNDIHPENIEIARRAAAIVGLDIAGIDFIAPDISRSVRETGGGVIEVNAAPGFRMHIEPSEGAPRDVARPVMEMLFPRGCRGRIPIIAITGTNGKSTVGRMVNHILRYTGRTVGLTSTSGVYVNDLIVAEGDATGPRSARMVLRDPSVEVAVLETARGGMLREGLAFDEADIAAVLNISADHLGLKGIETVEDLAAVKSLIVETVPRDGASVLNADDPLTVRMARRAGGRLIWFSLDGGENMPVCVRRHIDAGRTAVVREPGSEGGCLVLHRGGRREVIMAANDIPATLHGAATFNIANALAACAIAVAHDVPLLTIRSALCGFRSSFEQNPGRLNVHDAHGFRIIVDYAHNAAGLAAIGEMIDGLRHRYQRMIGCISIPGDRRDEDILEMGRLAARIFDEHYFREDPATRGRPRGQIMNLLKAGAIEAGADPERIQLVAGEAEATQAALRAARPGDLVVVTPTEVFAAWQQVCEFVPAEREFSAAPQPLYAAE
ncbi:cyanophycin synthetase [Sphingosinicella sp. CPCC 101087]|uniref:cyanophycin synthetase n=1 Tax=Sphingosinicella sp. CPCC 101087 TaxID=2497754 RepID=UPI001FB057AD|nr:cyanophycin synthetase [Sphingosinicella sp. CPCC 101087]